MMLALALPLVDAGSINGAQYEDRDTFFGWGGSHTRTINDNNVNVDADTLQGQDINDIENTMDYKDNNVLNNANTYADMGDLGVMDYADMGDLGVMDYADMGDYLTLKNAKKYTRKQDRKTLNKAKTYADNGDLGVMDYSDAGDVVAIATANAYADANDDKGSSFNKANMQTYIYGMEYIGYLDGRYVQQFDFAEVVFRNKAYMETLKYYMDHPNVEFHFEQSVNIKTARYMAEYSGFTQTTGKTTCTPNGTCVTI